MYPRISWELVAELVESAKHAVGAIALRGSDLSGGLELLSAICSELIRRLLNLLAYLVTGTISSTTKVTEDKDPICQVN
jgi:hypothetical protein